MNRTHLLSLVLIGCVSLGIKGEAALFSKKDSHTRGPALLEWDPSVRAAGMGGAFAGVADDAGALFWNPAGMGQVPQTEAAIGYADSFGEQTRGDLRFVRPVWWGQERRTWGLRAAYSSVKPFDLTENGEAGGTVHPQDFVVGASYEQPLGPVFVGGTLKGVRQDITVDAASTWAADFGVMGRGARLRWGASVLNLGPGLRTNAGTVALPTHVVAGGSWMLLDRRRKEVRDVLTLAVQLDAPVDDTPRPQAGLEMVRGWGTRMAIAGRVGYRSLNGDPNWLDKFTFGLGFSRDPFGLNYAYLPEKDLGGTQRFDVTLKFGGPLKQETRREELMAQAETLFAESHMVRARAAVGEALVISPNNRHARRLQRLIDSRIATSLDPETLLILGDQAFSEKRYQQAADFFKRLLEISPAYPEGRERWEKAEEKAGAERLKEAETRLKDERAREDRARRTRAARLMAQKNWPAARAAWENVLDLYPGDRSAQEGIRRCREESYSAAMSAERAGRFAEAIDLYRASQQGVKTYKDSAERLAALKSRAADQEAASAHRRKEDAQQMYEKGMAAYSAKDYETARRLFEEAVKANPGDKKAAKALERLKEEMGRLRP